ncbi:hypothetical protein B046DRAFT_05544 [Streptomyces sp. LamerLS-316]|uniref:hypothetical protein n=1 Tax=unclassified Streptomyces TaxID=2593676 RepID=UPI00082385EA|nr:MULTISPECIES: hypothetical protein [unclassified Streptomyces]MYQ36885.1 hypothetical protein [Streptomyces sp. SID4921]SCK51658.1 hypothetical protein B046DRAFT_05544 [Streptomyces sp. LamerLS-316]
MRHPFPAGAAVALAAAVLAACGSSGGQDHGDKEAAAAGGTPSVTAAASPTPSSVPTTAPGPRKPSSTPKAPAGELTPATGTFTKKQKEYLTDRVPKGMDPAAVLQTGQETCDRLRYLVKADRDIAVAAIVSGEVTGAEPAVTHLCPQHQDLVDEAALGYADGTYTGTELRAGRYRAPSPTDACSWQLTGAKGKEPVSGSPRAGEQVTVTVRGSTRTFTSTGCYAWLPQGDNG